MREYITLTVLVMGAMFCVWMALHVAYGCDQIANVLVPNGVSTDSPAPRATM